VFLVAEVGREEFGEGMRRGRLASAMIAAHAELDVRIFIGGNPSEIRAATCGARPYQKKGRRPLIGSLVGMCGVFSLAVEELEGICFDFDDELFDGDLDFFGFESGFDAPVVLARLQLALDEDVRAFDETVAEFAEAVTVGDNGVPLCAGLPFALIVFPGFRCGDGKLCDQATGVGQCLGFCVFADETNESDLIEIHLNVVLFCPFAWAPNSEGACSQDERMHSLGDRKNLTLESFGKARLEINSSGGSNESRRSEVAGRRVFARSGAK
jgi:hypothetical protein